MAVDVISTEPLIVSGINLEDRISQWISERSFSKIFILVDENTHQHCLPRLIGNVPALKNASILEVEPGEKSKSVEIAAGLWESMLDENADRKSLLINLGGGMITDLGGFTAATFMRGIRFINLPSSLLGMVDASAGGKTGINLAGKKNSIGVFRQADAVFADLALLRTLPARELISGTAEMIKHSLLQGTGSWKAFADLNFDRADELEDLVASSIRFKKSITDEDFYEAGKREQLNFGHTIAHALESLYLEKETELLHGEAVAAGIAMEMEISNAWGTGLDQDLIAEVREHISRHFPAVYFEPEEIDELIGFMESDKKNRDGKIHFSLLKSAGECLPSVAVDKDIISGALKKYLVDVLG